MANPYTGEVTLVVNGTPHVLKLTLGALAELEADLAQDSLVSLVQRFESGAFSSGDMLALLSAGLRGSGAALSRAELAEADIDGGVMQATRVAAQLLAVSFAAPAVSGAARV